MGVVEVGILVEDEVETARPRLVEASRAGEHVN